jgi:hypothetical protein
MMAFFSESRPSAGVYFTSPVWSREEQLTMASMGALFLGSPPPRWMTGSPLSRSMAAVSFSLRVGDSLMDLASWLKLMGVSLPFFGYTDSRMAQAWDPINNSI